MWHKDPERQDKRKDPYSAKPLQHLSLPQVTNRQVPLNVVSVWSYLHPHALYIIPTDDKNTRTKITSFLWTKFNLPPASVSIALLKPGNVCPKSILDFDSNLHQGVLLCLPSQPLTIRIHTKSGEVLTMACDLLHLVKDVKNELNKNLGVPKIYQELVCEGKGMRDNSLLLNYDVTRGLYLIIQPASPFSFEVVTFWGVTYTVEGSASTSVGQIIYRLLQRVCSATEHKESLLQLKDMYSTLIYLEYNGRLLPTRSCLGFHGIRKGATLELSCTSQQSDRSDTDIVEIITEETKSSSMIEVGQNDTWFVVALWLHGITKRPVDTMRLYVDEQRVKLESMIGGNSEARLTFSRPVTCFIKEQPLTINVDFPSGCKHSLEYSPRDTVGDVRQKLIYAGFPEASNQYLTFKGVKLPETTELGRISLTEISFWILHTSGFPVSIRSHGQYLGSVQVRGDWLVREFVHNIHSKWNIPPGSEFLYRGCKICAFPQRSLASFGVHAKSLIFIDYGFSQDNLAICLEKRQVIVTSRTVQAAMAKSTLADIADPKPLTNNIDYFIQWKFTYHGERKSRVASVRFSHDSDLNRVPLLRESTFAGFDRKDQCLTLEKSPHSPSTSIKRATNSKSVKFRLYRSFTSYKDLLKQPAPIKNNERQGKLQNTKKGKPSVQFQNLDGKQTIAEHSSHKQASTDGTDISVGDSSEPEVDIWAEVRARNFMTSVPRPAREPVALNRKQSAESNRFRDIYSFSIYKK